MRLRKVIPNQIILLLPIFVFMFIFLLYPIIWMFVWSFFHYDPMKITDYALTLENYKRFFFKLYYLRVLYKTAELSFLVTFVTLILGYPVAYYLAKASTRIKRIGIFLVITPIMVGLVVRTYGLVVLLEEKGLINSFLIAMGVIQKPIQILDTPTAAVIGLVEMFLPFAILPIISSLEKIDPCLEEAAGVLGCNRLKIFTKVIFPLSLPGIISGSLLVFSMTITAYVTPALLGGHSMTLMATLTYQNMLTSFNWPFGTAIAIILICLTAVFIMGYMRFFEIKGKSLI